MFCIVFENILMCGSEVKKESIVVSKMYRDQGVDHG